ncbi:hypothetical protein ASG39_04560 [Rhizobium sp. Leaf371]|uniref:hypothetical protein n=1 Tax=unclassified Rhizobium TaxID=2613769 RepID=UPI0007153972|nr:MULTISPECIES: hypothetical protein [unclassified Rhizobium]KQS72996.1 hypothetical protein ASG39_04560 [Rhizobium sp. Leaf371]TCM57220.1 hypothetical protein C8J36_1026 [Rhizobium sp. PP-F2F-G48]
MRTVMTISALVLGVALSQPAVAALGNLDSSLYADVALAGIRPSAPADATVSDQRAEICVPPDEQYIPSFVRDPGGRIVGVNYTIIEYVC